MSKKTTRATLLFSQLRTDGDTQPRVGLTSAIVDRYTDEMAIGIKFPPVDVFWDGESYWLVDGYHRLAAAEAIEEQTKCNTIDCRVHEGTLLEAQWFSYAANKSNSHQRSNNDKIRAVQAALAHPLAASLTDVAIGKYVGASDRCVGEWRAKLSSNGSMIASVAVTRNGTTYLQKRKCKSGAVNVPQPELEPVDTEASSDSITTPPVSAPKPEPAVTCVGCSPAPSVPETAASVPEPEPQPALTPALAPKPGPVPVSVRKPAASASRSSVTIAGVPDDEIAECQAVMDAYDLIENTEVTARHFYRFGCATRPATFNRGSEAVANFVTCVFDFGQSSGRRLEDEIA